MNFKFLIDLRQTAQYANFMQAIGWNVFLYKKSQLFIKKLPFLPFCVGKLLRTPLTLSIQEIQSLRKKYRLVNFSYEPWMIESNQNGRVYFKTNRHSLFLTPTKTLWVDLLQSPTQLKAAQKAKTRYNLKRSQTRLGWEILSNLLPNSKQITEIMQVWAANKPYSKLFPAPKAEFQALLSSFKDQAFIVRCFETRNPHITLAFCLVLCSSNMAFYWHNGSTVLGRQLFAPTLCVWQAILESKKRGLQVFDFEGLFDERFPRRNQDWKGFSRFKEGFTSVKSAEI